MPSPYPPPDGLLIRICFLCLFMWDRIRSVSSGHWKDFGKYEDESSVMYFWFNLIIKAKTFLSPKAVNPGILLM